MKFKDDFDFIVGFSLFTQRGVRTFYRHFNNLETAKLFASNENIKNNCKIYVDLDYHVKSLKEFNIEKVREQFKIIYGKQKEGE